MTTHQFNVLMSEIRLLREQSERIETRLREVEIIQATDEMARKVRQDLHTQERLGVQWKVGIAVSIVVAVMNLLLQVMKGV